MKKLNLPSSEFAVFGSGPLAVRKIRDSHDLDIVVKSSFWEKLTKWYNINSEERTFNI